MTADTDAIAARALALLTERTADRWSDEERASYPAYVIRKAVTDIAAGGERAALAQIISMVAGSPAAVQDLTDLCMDVIQQARHAQFAGNTGWIWNEKEQAWTARRGTTMLMARFPRDQMPPVRADWIGVMKLGGNWHGAVVRTMENPGEASLPWSSPVLAEIPEEFWTDDWRQGVRYKIVLGHLCSPCGRTDARVCLQPRTESQAKGDEAHCVPVDPDHVRLIVLDGKLSDYQ
jgi:hypothetical protein